MSGSSQEGECHSQVSFEDAVSSVAESGGEGMPQTE